MALVEGVHHSRHVPTCILSVLVTMTGLLGKWIFHSPRIFATRKPGRITDTVEEHLRW